MNDAAASNQPMTPMMTQFTEIKAANPDCLLFYRMGDFYELFFEDAIAASRALGITLTKRGKHMGEDIPMCGVPVHAADDYLQRLIRLGFRVAVCEQTEDPTQARKRGAKAVVRREVVRLVTPGTLTEDTLLDAQRHNYLAAVARSKGSDELAVAWSDISTGDLYVSRIAAQSLAAELARLEPGELIVPEPLFDDERYNTAWSSLGTAVVPLPAVQFDSAAGERRLRKAFSVAALESFGEFSRAELGASGALIGYISLTQVGNLPALKPPVAVNQDATMLIDAATRANLELTKTLHGERSGSLLSVIDKTITGLGSRLLADHLAAPLTNPAAINARLDMIAHFLELELQRASVRGLLAKFPDISRALGRLSLDRGGPRDLAAVRDGLSQAARIAGILEQPDGVLKKPGLIVQAISDLNSERGGLAERLMDVLAEEVPLFARDGGFVRPGYREELDEQRGLRDESRKLIAGLQSDYAAKTGIKTLKVRHNNVLGYFVEVTAQHAAKLQEAPSNETFFHRQTLASVMRFSTAELAELESKIAMAAERATAMELEIFADMAAWVGHAAAAITETADAAAALDVACGLAELAEKERYCRPAIDGSLGFEIIEGRHPVVEWALGRSAENPFVPNSCDLSADREVGADQENDSGPIWLLTGPNMAGKSTFLRQNALIAILAQIGAYVPAKSARIGVVDRLFSRVGAADDLARGRSTFMVEMVETATILNQASARSLVILDEIGRGTATFDGLSIAWACVEHLHETNKCRTVFATHFHELTALADKLPRLFNATMRVKEWRGDVIFLHEVTRGSADRSYGIQVAKLAGLPMAVIERASEVLGILEESGHANPGSSLADDLPLFSAARPRNPLVGPHRSSEVEERLRHVLPDELSPRDALELVYELAALLTKN